MNTKIIMTASAIALGLTGLMLTFIPYEILSYLNLAKSLPLLLLIQISGALYFAFAMLNWFTRTSLIGGIYNKPIALANFIHFTMAGVALIKGLIADPGLPYAIWGITTVYTAFSIVFAFMNFRNPSSVNKQS